MGLAERRGVTEFRETEFPKYQKLLNDITGFPVVLEVNWDSMGKEGYAHRYNENYQKVFFTPLMNAFKAICGDQMGKDAMKAGLKKIVIDGTSGHSPGSWSFKDGVLTMLHDPCTNVDDIQERTKWLTATLEKNL